MAEQKKAPLIGADFSGPKGNAPRTSPLQSKDVELEPTIEEIIKQEEEPEEEKKDVVKEYRERLVELMIAPEEARKMLDDILFGGGYEEEFLIGGKLKITLRTRKYRDLQRTLRYIDNEAPLSPTHINDLVARHNTAASLAIYNERTFSFPNPEEDGVGHEDVETAFQKRFEFINNLDAPIIERVIAKTAEFDTKVAAVLAEGAPEDF